ncbi:MAG: helix-turn-helix transcriptional regulator [Clostridia bacterium]|nr:helix-turn-helix transcriptional regulator [Clostridia bacterium]
MIYINVKEILKKQGKTKYWLVKNMEGSYQSITAMMNNETTGIKFDTLEKLCNLLECTPNDIIKIKK